MGVGEEGIRESSGKRLVLRKEGEGWGGVLRGGPWGRLKETDNGIT